MATEIILISLCVGMGLAGLLLALGYVCWRRAPRALTVLVFEKVGIPPKNSCLKDEWVSPRALGRWLNLLARHRFTTLSPDSLNTKLPPRGVLLAFMGGYRSFYTEVFPLLKQYRMKAVVFLPTELIGAYNAWQNPHREPWQDLLSAGEIKSLQKSGLVFFGALALNGEDITLLPPGQAKFVLEESAFRLQKQHKITPGILSTYPARTNRQKAVLQSLHLPYPVVSTQTGTNNLPLTGPVLLSLFPVRRPVYTGWQLFKQK